METVFMGWADIPELRFNATAQALTIVYASGETRMITAVSRGGFERLVGRPDGSAAAEADRLGRVWQALAVCLSTFGSMTRHFNFGQLTAGGGDNAAIRNRLVGSA